VYAGRHHLRAVGYREQKRRRAKSGLQDERYLRRHFYSNRARRKWGDGKLGESVQTLSGMKVLTTYALCRIVALGILVVP
jgi:hypothetical protein